MVEDSPLQIPAMIASSEWGQQLSSYGWVDDDDVVFHVGLATAEEKMWAFNRAQADALGPHLRSDASTAIAAVATVLPAHLHLFVSSGKRRLALWQNEPRGTLALLQFVSLEEMQQFPDHRISCPLGHTMPCENKSGTLDDHFRVSAPEYFASGARRYEAQLEEYFALTDQAARSAWLDASRRGRPGEMDAERLDPVFVPGGEFLRCTGRCGYYKWYGSWLRDAAMS